MGTSFKAKGPEQLQIIPTLIGVPVAVDDPFAAALAVPELPAVPAVVALEPEWFELEEHAPAIAATLTAATTDMTQRFPIT